MKVAFVHDYIKEYGGAERVLEALHEIWPDAPVYTSVYLPGYLGPHKERFKNWDIRTSWFQYVPYKAKLISPLRIIAPFVFRQFDFSAFDVVIVSATGAYFPNLLNKKSALHICYCHTPPRYLYGYATAREWKKHLVFRILGEIANHFLRIVDYKSSEHVDYFIANSQNIAARIKKFYKREATVIYPPVDTESSKRKAQSSKQQPKTQNYFLAGGRLARPKHIDLIVRACRELNFPLKVFGKGFGGYENEICHYSSSEGAKRPSREVESEDSSRQALTIKNIEFLGEITDEEKYQLMAGAKAYIFAAEDEDFGITPVEAMAAGTPVIAYRSGGVVESVLEGRTGIFFDELTVKSLITAIKQCSNVAIRPQDCIAQAQKFSKERFKKEIQAFVEKAVKSHRFLQH